MVNPPTQLFKEYPDWIYHYETRKTNLGRNRYCLNVSKPEVKQFIFDILYINRKVFYNFIIGLGVKPL